MKQPLSYQTLLYSCWVTSILNAILWLYGDKDKIPGFVLRLLHTVLTDTGVNDTHSAKPDWEVILDAIASRCGFQIRSYRGPQAAKALEAVDFHESVAVCDIQAGGHSILINGREGDYYFGFDPDWGHVTRDGSGSPAEGFETFPTVDATRQDRVNLKIHKRHLLSARYTPEKKFAMGASGKRIVTVLTRK